MFGLLEWLLNGKPLTEGKKDSVHVRDSHFLYFRRMENARLIFESINVFADVANLIGKQENAFLEFKVSKIDKGGCSMMTEAFLDCRLVASHIKKAALSCRVSKPNTVFTR